MKGDYIKASMICVTLVLLAISFSTLAPTSWSQVKNELQNGTQRDNLDLSKVTATQPLPSNATAIQPLPSNATQKHIEIENDTHSYNRNSTAKVKAGNSNSTIAFCDVGDLLLNGGYSIGFKMEERREGKSVQDV